MWKFSHTKKFSVQYFAEHKVSSFFPLEIISKLKNFANIKIVPKQSYSLYTNFPSVNILHHSLVSFSLVLIIFSCCCSYCLVAKSCDTMAVAHQAPLSMEFSSQEFWSGWPCPSPGDLPDPRMERRSPSLIAGSFFSIEEIPYSELEIFNVVKMSVIPT